MNNKINDKALRKNSSLPFLEGCKQDALQKNCSDLDKFKKIASGQIANALSGAIVYIQ